jgi:retinol dehydrogenase-12
MSDLAGRTFLVTGANTGIGRATAEGLAGRGGRVYVASRSPEKGAAAVAAIKASAGSDTVWFLPLDLADLDSVRACASSFLARDEPLHGCLEASAPARVVTVASDSHYAARGIDWDALRRPERGVTGLHGYAVSKLCNVLFSAELGRRTAGTGVTTYALHPGVVASDIWRRVPWPVRPLVTRRMLTVSQGAETSLYCATSLEVAADSGLFYEKCAEREPSSLATPELAAELWKRSEEWAAAS